MDRSFIIGTIVIGPGETYRRLYETASWYTDYAIPPGTYEVTGYLDSARCFDAEGKAFYICNTVYYRAAATVTASLFVDRLFWATSSKKDENVGAVEEVSVPVSLTDPRITFKPSLLLEPPARFASAQIDLKVARAPFSSLSREAFCEAARAAVLKALDTWAKETGMPLPAGQEGATDADLPALFAAIDAQVDRLIARASVVLLDNPA